MPRYEYKVVPAPAKGLKAKGIKGAEARFAHALATVMNDMAVEGWEYQRAETLPSVERSGLTGSTTEWRNMLVFRRPHPADAEAFAPELLPAPDTAPGAAVAAAAAAAGRSEPPVTRPSGSAGTAPATPPLTAEDQRDRANASWQDEVTATSDVAPNTAPTERLGDLRTDSAAADEAPATDEAPKGESADDKETR